MNQPPRKPAAPLPAGSSHLAPQADLQEALQEVEAALQLVSGQETEAPHATSQDEAHAVSRALKLTFDALTRLDNTKPTV